MMAEIQIFQEITCVSDNFSALLLDAYGVFWGGNATGLLPGAKQAMEKLIQNGKIVGVLSNSTQLAEKEIAKLQKAGLIQGVHFHFLITSGEVAKQVFTNGQLPFETPNRKYWLFGAVHPKFGTHHPLFENSSYTETSDIQEADFIYISIPHQDGEDQQNVDIFREQLAACQQYNKPMVCANPDRFAHEGNPPRPVVRQGSIAALYMELGGEVFYIGKPSAIVYLAAMEHFKYHSITSPTDVLMVGDNPETDIRGARNFGMPSALLTSTGLMAERLSEATFETVLKRLPPHDLPDYFVERLGAI